MIAEPVPAAPPQPPPAPRPAGRWAIRGGMLVAVLGWLWPIGLGGQVPVGGDATQFSLGLMAFLRESLRAGRLPLWNDLWGFGFPGLAESQMGVYYPPHWGYALLSTESAYAASLVAHFLWGPLGAAWFARRLGASEVGAALGGFAWATSGFFLIHLPHQWAYTVGSWMPWAWGLAWQAVRGPSPARASWGLAAVLAVQILPGHFQMAFVTEVGALTLAIAGARWRRPYGLLGVLAALGATIPLAACQLLPTRDLAALAGGERGFEYLSGFAASPVHLVSFVAPGLFHRSPLWRPVAWDLFHTSPEEYLGYVGIVPLLLALRAGAGWRQRVEVRALLAVGLASLFLGLGPYAPGFRALIALPGFSFFRAPARWNLATSLALAALAGLGWDEVRRSGWRRRAVLGFVAAAGLAVGLVVGGFELALRGDRREAFQSALDALPWSTPGRDPDLARVLGEAYRPQADLRVRSAQARLDGRPFPSSGMVLARERGGIYARELLPSAAVLAALAAVGFVWARRPRALAGALVVLSAGDLIAAGRARPFDLGPIRPLVEQSPVLARAAREGRGFRTLDPGQNLFQVAGADSATAYRTLTLPAPGAGLDRARGIDPADPGLADSLRGLGIDARVLDPFEARAVPAGWTAGGWGRPGETIADPTLAGWLYGADFARLNGASDFRWVAAARPASRAWRVDDVAMIERPGGDLLARLARAEPLAWRSPRPGRFEVDWRAEPNPAGRTWVVISQTFDPEWGATWVNGDDQARPATVVRTAEGWQAVGVGALPPGGWTLRLDYRGATARLGLAVSAASWAAWVAAGAALARRGRRARIRDEGGAT